MNAREKAVERLAAMLFGVGANDFPAEWARLASDFPQVLAMS